MGAWEYGNYKAVTRAWDNPRLGAALIAIKKELVYNGFGENLEVEKPVFGEAAANRVREFQQAKGLTVDGQVGPVTAKELFRKRVEQEERNYDLPVGTIGRKLKLESNFDPVAIGGADPDDTGISQINRRIHTSVSLEEAFDPAFSIDWAAKYVSQLRRDVAARADVLKAARAAYNIGSTYATRWMLAGFPASGGPDMGGGVDAFARATQYISLVDRQDW